MASLSRSEVSPAAAASAIRVLASDAAHFYENIWARKPFPIVVDLQDMLDGFARLEALASAPGLIVPGHDPLVGAHFPRDMADHIWRLDHGPVVPLRHG